MNLLDQYVKAFIALTAEEQTKILERMLQTFSRYPTARLKLLDIFLLIDVRQQRTATRAQWTDLVALGLDLRQGDQELADLLRRPD